MHPSDETLAALAMGEPTDQVSLEHVRSCPRCRAVVDEFSGLTVRVKDAAGVRLQAPPESVWAQIAAETAEPDRETAAPDRESARSDRPDETAWPIQQPSGPARRRFSRRWVIGGVAAGVAVGVLAGVVVPQVTQPRPQMVAQASLQTLDTRQAQGQATVTGEGSALDLTLKVQPLTAGAGFLEVWLINTDLKRMVSIGVLPNGATQQQFPITGALLEQGYLIVDISREPFDDRPQHSGDSLLRGELS